MRRTAGQPLPTSLPGEGAQPAQAAERPAPIEGVVVGDQTIINAGAVIGANVKIWPSKEIDEGATISSSIIWGSQGRRVLFGRNGISGLVNIDLTPEFCARLGAAFGATLPRGSTVTMNRDAHYTPRMLKRAMIAGLPSMTSSTSWRPGSFGGWPNSVMSAPAMKVRPAQAMTTAPTPWSAAACRTPSRSPSRTPWLKALTGG